MFTFQVQEFFQSCGNAIRGIISSTSPTTQDDENPATFAATLSKHLGLCGLWAKLIQHERLPPSSRADVAALTAAMQSTAVQLAFLRHSHQASLDNQHTESVRETVHELQQQCADSFDICALALDECERHGELPDFGMTLKRLQDNSRELCETVTDERARRTTMCRLLELSGQYVALTEAIADCHRCLHDLDWKGLSRSYF